MSDSASAARQQRIFRWLALALGLVLAAVLVEATAWILMQVTEVAPAASAVRDERRQLLAAAAAVGDGADDTDIRDIPLSQLRFHEREVVHPFVGYVHDFRRTRRGRNAHYTAQSKQLGFPNHADLVAPRDAARWVVAVVGGSFAEELVVLAGEAFEAAFDGCPRLAGRQVTVLGLGMGGYKQPQQLATVSYLLTLGAHLDAVVNLDGFNEIALPAMENLPVGVHPAFPRGWQLRVASLNPDARRQLGEIEFQRQRRLDWARSFATGLRARSSVANLVWWRIDRSYRHHLARLEEALRVSTAEDDFQATGPAYDPEASDPEADMVAIWQRGSRLLAGLTRSQGIEYHHVLQPNQYVEGSKPLSDEERRDAFVPASIWRQRVDAGYPRLRAAGAELRREGVAFHDFVDVFENDQATYYADRCCHLNREGYAVFGARLAEVICSASPTSSGSGSGS